VADWTQLGEVSVTGADTRVVIGPFSIKEGDDTIWVQTEQTSPVGPWPWSYGILTWQSSFGRELGSTKAYTAQAGEVCRLGVGRAPRSRTGRIIYEPRSFNLAWVKEGYPLTLAFSAVSGPTTSESGGRSVAFPIDGHSWKYASSSGLLQLEM